MRKGGYIFYTLFFVFIIFYLASCSTSEERRWSFPEAHSNPEICEQYTAWDLCYSEVARFNSNPVMCQLINDSETRDFCYFSIATDYDGVAEGVQNPSLCENTSTTFGKESCYYTVAQNTKDPRYRDSCYGIVAQKGGDHTICSKSEDINNEYRCYSFVADKTGDASICESITDFEVIKNLCIAMAKRDPTLCESLPEAGNTRDSCYINIASSTKNKKLCSKIASEGIKDDCLSLNIFKPNAFKQLFQ